MRHNSIDELKQTATVVPATAELATPTRAEKIERWADLLEAHDAPLRPFHRVEYLSRDERGRLQGAHTPLAVAFADPVLRSWGLSSDNYDVGRLFFGLSEAEAHHALCDCHYPGGMHSANVATRLRALANKDNAKGFWYRAWEAVSRQVMRR